MVAITRSEWGYLASRGIQNHAPSPFVGFAAFGSPRTDNVFPGADINSIWGSSYFDAEWYLSKNPDLAAALRAAEGSRRYDAVDRKKWAMAHYTAFGGKPGEARDPGPNFSSSFYFARYPDVAAANMPALWHYERFGKSEGRSIDTPGWQERKAAADAAAAAAAADAAAQRAQAAEQDRLAREQQAAEAAAAEEMQRAEAARRRQQAEQERAAAAQLDLQHAEAERAQAQQEATAAQVEAMEQDRALFAAEQAQAAKKQAAAEEKFRAEQALAQARTTEQLQAAQEALAQAQIAAKEAGGQTQKILMGAGVALAVLLLSMKRG